MVVWFSWIVVGVLCGGFMGFGVFLVIVVVSLEVVAYV